jgi:hypothetical protein
MVAIQKWLTLVMVAALAALLGSLFASLLALGAGLARGQSAGEHSMLDLMQTIPLRGAPGRHDDLFFAAKRERLYASCGAGFLTVLQRQDPDRYAVVERIATGKLARTCLFDAESGRLYLPVPRQERKNIPELRVYQARP